MKVYVVVSVGCLECGGVSEVLAVTTSRDEAMRSFDEQLALEPGSGHSGDTSEWIEASPEIVRVHVATNWALAIYEKDVIESP